MGLLIIDVRKKRIILTSMSIFQHKNWGTSTVLNDTLQDLKNNSISFLEELNDIDTYEDLEKNTKLKQLINAK